VTSGESPLYALLNEINKAAAGGLPLLAIAMTVALPDICVSLVSDDGRSTGERYKEWCAANLGPKFDYVTGDDLWSMRCGVLHNGRFGDLKHNVARVIFVPAGATANTFVNGRVNDAYFYSVVEFCRNFSNAVFVWCEKNKDNINMKTNAPRLMQYRDDGLAPYIIGASVLA
jgi:hypothetical protein